MINFYKDNLTDNLDKMHDFVDHYKDINFSIHVKAQKLETEIKDFKKVLAD